MRLYTVQITAYPEDEGGGQYALWPGREISWQPVGWLSDAEARAEWIERHGDARFFWPKTGLVYKSRSAAQNRADLIESYGARAEVLVTETAWRSLADARAEREKDRRDARVAVLRARIAEIEAVS